MRIVWVSFAPLRKTQAGGLTSDLASVRYRLTLPAQVIPGSKVTYVGPGANRRTLLERFAGADAAVFGKVFDTSLAQATLELAEALRQRGVRIIADYSDDHFLDRARGPVYRAMAVAADAVVASTPGLAEVVQAHTPVRVNVVTDPVEGERGEPRASGTRPPSLVWFGHPLNLDTLPEGLEQLARRRIPFALTVLTAPGAGAESLGHRFRAWSTEALFEELRECDAVIIPSNPHDPRKAVKSPNRFTEALWAGRFVIAHPLPAYEPLASCGWVGEDLGEGLAWLLEQPGDALERIRAGQELVARTFSPAAVGRAWQAVISREEK
jgi:glycosyltransferase involved in cell wall biosynthesis